MTRKKRLNTHSPRPAHEVVSRCGGSTVVGQALGLPKQNVHGWKRVPPEYVHLIQAKFGIPATWMRPDVFPPGFVPLPENAPIPEPKQRPYKPLRRKAA